MNSISFFAAQIDAKDTLIADLHKTGVSRSGLTLLFSAFGIVTLLVLVWAIFIRKRPNAASRRYSYSSREFESVGGINPSLATADHGGRKRRRRRRRSRNPTLAETGGLPPIRREGYLEDPP